VRFVGNVGKPTLQMIDSLQLRDVVETTGYLHHREAIAHLMAADALILIVGPGPGSEIVLPGKIFEYLASGKPILGLVPPGVSADLIREANAGFVVDPQDVQGIAAQIRNMYERWQLDRLSVHTDSEVVARFNRHRLTGQLASVLDRVSRHQPQDISPMRGKSA
ncbi:MAG: glycosyltransferase, partial [Anaerolineales bacterium]